MSIKKLTPEEIALIEATLTKDQRVELIPTKDGIKIICVKRNELKT